MKKCIIMVVLLSLIISCGHKINPAPSKVEVNQTNDQTASCANIKEDILDMQAKRTSTQKQIDQQFTNNIIGGIGTVTIFASPLLFLIDGTTQKNDAYNSYQEREEYLRELAIEKNCSDLPPQYVYDKNAKPKIEEKKSIAKAGTYTYTLIGKGYGDNEGKFKFIPDGAPIIGKDIIIGDHINIKGKEFGSKGKKDDSGNIEWVWVTYTNERQYTVSALQYCNFEPWNIQAPEGELIVIIVVRDKDGEVLVKKPASGGNAISTPPKEIPKGNTLF
jgi:hypothetical protein